MTGLRGVASMLVVTYHYYPPGSIADPALGRFIGKGYLWVDLFFVLSGFLMAMNYAHLFVGGWSLRGWFDFLLRRLARIYPLYFVLVTASLVYTLAAYGQLQLRNPAPAVTLDHPVSAIAANMLLIQSWGIASSINGTAWSLSAEWAAYLLFPMLLGLALFGRAGLALVAGMGVAAMIAVTVGLTMHDGGHHSGPLDAYDGTTLQPILRCLGGFLLGLLTYRAAQSARVLVWAGNDATTGLVIFLLAAGLANGIHDLAIYPLFAALVLGLYGNRGMIGRLLGSRPIHWLGINSYSIYLLHGYLIAPRHGLDEWLQTWIPTPSAHLATSFASYGVLVLIACLAYRGIEEPGRRLLHRFGRAALPAPSSARA
jgi:peptidoglycan/LPS O-acetylase OafA/YrhL